MSVAVPPPSLPCSYEEPAIEDLYRVEQELNRVGKTRSESKKIRPLREEVVERIKLVDAILEGFEQPTTDQVVIEAPAPDAAASAAAAGDKKPST